MYETVGNDITGLFTLDKDLSKNNLRVYVDSNPDTNRKRVLVAFRPLMFNNDDDKNAVLTSFISDELFPSTQRYRTDKQELLGVVMEKYKPEDGYEYHFSGHSLGGSIAMQISSDPDITQRLSRASSPEIVASTRVHAFNPGYMRHFANSDLLRKNATAHFSVCDPVLRIMGQLDKLPSTIPPAYFYTTNSLVSPQSMSNVTDMRAWLRDEQTNNACQVDPWKWMSETDPNQPNIKLHGMSTFWCLDNDACGNDRRKL